VKNRKTVVNFTVDVFSINIDGMRVKQPLEKTFFQCDLLDYFTGLGVRLRCATSRPQGGVSRRIPRYAINNQLVR
jgi:hypothetical protein